MEKPNLIIIKGGNEYRCYIKLNFVKIEYLLTNKAQGSMDINLTLRISEIFNFIISIDQTFSLHGL